MTAKTLAWGNTRPAKSRAIFKMIHYRFFWHLVVWRRATYNGRRSNE